MAIGDFDTSDWTPLHPEEEKALEMAQEFIAYCRKYNFKPSLMIAGVAWNGSYIEDKAYSDGVNDERNRIKEIFNF